MGFEMFVMLQISIILCFNKLEVSSESLHEVFSKSEIRESEKFLEEIEEQKAHAEMYPLSSFDTFDNLDFNATDVNDTTAIVEDLNVEQIFSDALEISWTVTGANVTKFLIQWFKDDLPVDEITVNFSEPLKETFVFKITNLDACKEYRIVVKPHMNGPFEDKDVFAKTSETQPGAPLILTADPCDLKGTLALNISWQRPKVGGFCIVKYSVSVESKIHDERHFITRNTSDSSIMMNHLYACTSYLVTVKSVGLNDMYGLSATIQSKPTSRKLPGQPRLINNQHLPPLISNTTSIIFNWYVFDEENNCTIKSVFTECQYSYTNGYGYDLDDGKSNYTVKSVDPKKVMVLVDKLSPYTKYYCSGRISNEAGEGKPSFPFPVYTMEDVPSAPQNFTFFNESTFTWKPPAVMPGRLQRYEMTFSWLPRYPVPDFCQVKRKYVVDDISSRKINYTWHGGDGYSDYNVDIVAYTKAGGSRERTAVAFQTHARGVPDRVTKLEYETKPSANDSNILETTLSWNLPCSLRGRLKHFEVFVIGTKNNLANHTIRGKVDVPQDYDKNARFGISLGELWPQYFYKFHVSATIHESSQTGEVAVYDTEYPAGIPPVPTKDYMEVITLKPTKMPRTTTSIEVLLPLFKNTNGDVKYYAIIVSRLGFHFERAHKRFCLDDENAWPNISTWKEAMSEDFEIPYQVTEPRWTPYPNYIVDYGSVKAVKFLIGEDVTCDALTSDSRLYCNGPLKPDTAYQVWMRAFTNGGYSDSDYIVVITDKEVSVYLIIGVVLGILTLGIIAAVLLNKISHYEGKKDPFVEEESDLERYRNRRPTISSNPGGHESASAPVRTRRPIEQSNQQN